MITAENTNSLVSKRMTTRDFDWYIFYIFILGVGVGLGGWLFGWGRRLGQGALE